MRRTQAPECSHLCGQFFELNLRDTKQGWLVRKQLQAVSMPTALQWGDTACTPTFVIMETLNFITSFCQDSHSSVVPHQRRASPVSPTCSEFSQPGLGRILDTWDSEHCSQLTENWAWISHQDSLDSIKTAENYFCENIHTYLCPSI